jgi:ubiquinone/menaquinone biosynthesis C-methylase UbiE
LELGCGNGWVSWLLAKAGFETWMCDSEANSLATGLGLEHPNIGPGRRFVTDARYAPFRSGSFDLVMLKEFVHHVREYRTLFREANRVLRHGGVLALMDPLRGVWKTVSELRHPDPHEEHHIH